MCLAWASLLSLLSVASCITDSKAVTTSLTTKWNATPLLLEASEFLAEESQEMFWDFVEAIQNTEGERDVLVTVLTPTLRYPVQPLQVIFCVALLLSVDAEKAAAAGGGPIASNEAPPPGCAAFFSVHGEKTCDTEDLEGLLETAATSVHGEKTCDTEDLEGLLETAATRTLYPEIKELLKELRKHLVESTNEMAPLKVWQMQDLSFQTAARILAAPVHYQTAAQWPSIAAREDRGEPRRLDVIVFVPVHQDQPPSYVLVNLVRG
ncbi:hypothetical protein CRUP_023719 [Coryphaenoides rupestris]|nr:hypothetical protein CRUP_023719 [Coryphaenoides rupestris]